MLPPGPQLLKLQFSSQSPRKMQMIVNDKIIESAFYDDAKLRKRVFDAISMHFDASDPHFCASC